MATRRKYSPEQKAAAAGLAAAVGQTEAERQTGIPKETIHYWLGKPEFAHLRTTAREEVATAFWAAVQVGLEAVAAGFRDPDTSLRDKAQALAVVYDRHALLTGGATARTEARDLTGTLSDAELLAAVREAERIAGGGGAAEAPADPAAG